MSLSPRQNNFLLYLLMGISQQEAYEKAGYKAKGPIAASNASTLIRNPKFSKHYKRALAEIQAKIVKPLEVTRDRVLNEYAKLAFSNPKKFYDNDGNLIPIHELDDDIAACLTGMEVKTINLAGDTDGVFDIQHLKKIKWSDKKSALDSLSRVLGMFEDKVKVGLDTDSLDKLFDQLPEEFAIVIKAIIAKKAQAQITEK